jgi:hypothetical protein
MPRRTTGWLAGNQSWDQLLTPHIPQTSDCSYSSDRKCWRLKWVTHGQVSPTEGRRTVKNLQNLILLVWAAFLLVERMLNKFGGSEGRSRFGHSDPSSSSEQSFGADAPRIEPVFDRSLEMALRPPLFCGSSGRVSNLLRFGSLIEC